MWFMYFILFYQTWHKYICCCLPIQTQQASLWRECKFFKIMMCKFLRPQIKCGSKIFRLTSFVDNSRFYETTENQLYMVQLKFLLFADIPRYTSEYETSCSDQKTEHLFWFLSCWMKLVDRATCHDFVSMVQFLSDGKRVGKITTSWNNTSILKKKLAVAPYHGSMTQLLSANKNVIYSS